MRRFINGLTVLILAAAITAGCAYLYDYLHQRDMEAETSVTDVTSGLTGRIYALDSGTDLAIVFESLGETADAYAEKKIASSGGGGYTDSSGSYHYVPSSNSGGGYSGSGEYSGGGSSSGGGGSGGYLVPAEEDETEWNYCQDCGTWYTGGGDCPNPDCPGRHPQ